MIVTIIFLTIFVNEKLQNNNFNLGGKSADIHFIEEMNNALTSGKQIICGKKKIKNWYSKRRDARSLVSNCTALTYVQIDNYVKWENTERVSF